MPSPAELLSELKSLLDKPGTGWDDIAPLRRGVLEIGGKVASEAVGMIDRWLDRGRAVPPPVEPGPAPQPQPQSQSQSQSQPQPQRDQQPTKHWLGQLVGWVLGRFGTQTGQNSLVGVVLAVLTIFGVRTFSTTPSEVKGTVDQRADTQQQQLEKLADQITALKTERAKLAAGEQARKFFAPEDFAAAVKTATDGTTIPETDKAKLPGYAKQLAPKLLDQWNKK